MSNKCNRCGNVWEAMVLHPKACPRCKSPYWNSPRSYRLKSRPELVPTGSRKPFSLTTRQRTFYTAALAYCEALQHGSKAECTRTIDALFEAYSGLS